MINGYAAASNEALKAAAAGNETSANRLTDSHDDAGAPVTAALALASWLDKVPASVGSSPAAWTAESWAAVRW